MNLFRRKKKKVRPTLSRDPAWLMNPLVPWQGKDSPITQDQIDWLGQEIINLCIERRELRAQLKCGRELRKNVGWLAFCVQNREEEDPCEDFS